MSKTKLYLWVILALIITNILTFSLFVIPKKHPQKGPRNLVIKKLDFDEKQIQQYDELIKVHRSKIEDLDQKILDAKKKLYKTLESQDNTAKTDSLTSEIANFQKEVELVHYHHYLDIKKITHPDQLEKYNKLTEEITDIFPQGKKPKP